MQLDDILPDMREKAGFIPYVIENGEPLFLFMIPSNPLFGGSRPCIAKGGVDRGETLLEAAIREAKEELGLKKKNIKRDTVQLVFSGKINGKKNSYRMTVFVGEVKDKEKFGAFTFETAETRWLTLKEFSNIGRDSHVGIVRKAHTAVAFPNKYNMTNHISLGH